MYLLAVILAVGMTESLANERPSASIIGLRQGQDKTKKFDKEPAKKSLFTKKEILKHFCDVSLGAECEKGNGFEEGGQRSDT